VDFDAWTKLMKKVAGGFSRAPVFTVRQWKRKNARFVSAAIDFSTKVRFRGILGEMPLSARISARAFFTPKTKPQTLQGFQTDGFSRILRR
jgi:hypothetical protein